MSDKPGYLFQASIQIGQNIALSINGNLPMGAAPKEIENELDRIFSAMEKQQLKRMKLPAVKGELQDQKDALERTKKRFEELAFQEQGRKLTSADKAQQETCAKQISNLTVQIESGQKILDALEKEAA